MKAAVQFWNWNYTQCGELLKEGGSPNELRVACPLEEKGLNSLQKVNRLKKGLENCLSITPSPDFI